MKNEHLIPLIESLNRHRQAVRASEDRLRRAASTFHAAHGTAWADLMQVVRAEGAILSHGHDVLLSVHAALQAYPLTDCPPLYDLELDPEQLTLPVDPGDRYLELEGEELETFDGWGDTIYHTHSAVVDAVLRRLCVAAGYTPQPKEEE